jgi:hypothetical protein
MERIVKEISHIHIDEDVYIEKTEYSNAFATFKIYLSSKILYSNYQIVTLVNNGYYELSELESHLDEFNYQTVLLHLLEICKTYDQVNFVFNKIRNVKFLDSQVITKILNHCLNSVLVRNSYEAKRYMLSFIVDNVNQITPVIYHKIISDFPHMHPNPIAPYLKNSNK